MCEKWYQVQKLVIKGNKWTWRTDSMNFSDCHNMCWLVNIKMSLISAEIFDWEEVEITWRLEFYNKIKVKRVSTFMDG